MKNIEEYTKNLSPELQEKARACTDFADLMKLAAANDVELNTDQLEAVAGGCGGSGGGGNTEPDPRTFPEPVPPAVNDATPKCYKCGSYYIRAVYPQTDMGHIDLRCIKCGNVWTDFDYVEKFLYEWDF